MFWEDAEQRLVSMADEKYRNFSQKLNPNIRLIGVSIPKVRKLALSYMKTEDIGILMSYPPLTAPLEIKILKVIFLSRLPLSLSSRLEMIEEFLPYLDGWAICDLMCSELKECRVHKKEYFDFIKKILHRQKSSAASPYTTRFFCVIALMYFADNEYVNDILEEIKQINCTHYYVMMGVAWLLATLYLKVGDSMLAKIKALHLDKRTHNTTIQKILDSRTIGSEEKQRLKQEKIK